MIKQYRKLPVVIEAVEWTGNNYREITEFCSRDCYIDNGGRLAIETLEGDHNAEIGDMIIEGIKGECYPCKSDIFKLTYEVVNDKP